MALTVLIVFLERFRIDVQIQIARAGVDSLIWRKIAYFRC